MPWPEFSEFSFGFAFLREFERCHAPGATFPAAPDFITQNAEAAAGYDVEVQLHNATPVFFQFKRSLVLSTRRAWEVQEGYYPAPTLYRMYLRKKNEYAQHKSLQALEAAGNRVFYVTSQMEAQRDLNAWYVAQQLLQNGAALFSPSEIILPDDHGDHWVTFRAADGFGSVFSDNPNRFVRETPNWDAVVRSLVSDRLRMAWPDAAMGDSSSGCGPERPEAGWPKLAGRRSATPLT